MLRPHLLLAALAILLAGIPVAAQAQPVPLVAAYSMQTANGKLVDAGPLHYDGQVQNVQVIADGHSGSALRFDGAGSQVTIDGPFIQKLSGDITLAAWIKVEQFPQKGGAWVIAKGGNQGFQLGIGDNRAAFFHGFWGGWYDGPWGGKLPLNEWAHLAFTFKKGDKGRITINGEQVSVRDTPYAFWPVGDPLKLGGANWAGLLDEVHIYAAQLSPEQVRLDMQGKLSETRAPVEGDFPELEYPLKAALVRFDQPIGGQEFIFRSRQTARRVPGPDAVDWPQLTLRTPRRTIPLWRESAEQDVTVPLPPNNGRSLFRQPWDNVVEPVDKWFRVQPWLWDQFWGYTTDLTAQTGTSDYELWAFPVKIEGADAADIRQVTLRLDEQTIYERNENLRSLMLLLPQNPDGKPYELTVNGRGPLRFDAGLAPPKLGEPHFVPIKVDLTVPGDGPPLRVFSPAQPEAFPNPKEWDEDMNKRGDGIPPFTLTLLNASWHSRLGLDVPRSPISIFAVNMSHGMSGGFFFQSEHTTGFLAPPPDYAEHIAAMGFDCVFDKANNELLRKPGLYGAWFSAMAERGVQAGLTTEGPVGHGAMLGHANQAFFAHNLPDWHAPLFREYQLLAQRFRRYPNFAGLFSGADNAGYVPYWDWAPPHPNRPWARAFVQWMRGNPLKAPVGPALSPGKDYEIKATQRQFIDYIHRYDETFRQYGYFAEAVRQVDPALVFTTGSFGSSPGVGGRGGWPWATVPGQPMFEKMSIQTAYDWNELDFTKPLHNVALIDRLRSYYPDKTTWTIIDNFNLHSGREAQQRDYALALTRGVQAVGTNFLAHTTGEDKTPGLERAKSVVAEQELFAWIHRFGGAFATTEPQPVIGVLYVHEQAISRQAFGDEKPPPEKLYHGSHEGKTTEALFLCHAAGWPAKIITPEELQRGVPASMKAILLTGLNPFDGTWVWHEGLAPALQKFVQGRGRILLDDESVSPVTSVKTGVQIAAYIPQGVDFAPLLFERNRDNIAKLRTAMQDVAKPFATSDDPTIWAIPSQTGDVQYVTVVNWGYTDGQNASKVVKPQTGKLTWNTQRPIYDVPGVRAQNGMGRKLTAPEAAMVNLTRDAFHVYALPPAPLTAPKVDLTAPQRLTRGAGRIYDSDGYYYATVTVGATPIRGVPVQLTISKILDEVTVYGTSGTPIKIPISIYNPGDYAVVATELLSGQSSRSMINVPLPDLVSGDLASPFLPGVAQHFTALAYSNQRKDVPLVVALTPEQAQDATIKALAERLVQHFQAQGRRVTLDRIEPGRVVRSLQPLKAIQRYPQWQTVEADLVLLGNPQNNVLLLDQARGYLLPGKVERPAIQVTHSPFVGEYDAVNLLANDAAGLEAAVKTLTGAP